MRLMLLPALRRIPRGRSTIQLGVGPEHATTLEFTDRSTMQVLTLLDGTRTEAQVARDAGRFGVNAAATRRLVNALRAAGLVIDRRALLPAELPEDTRARLRPEAGALSLRSRPGDRSPAGILRRRRASAVLVNGRGRMVAAIGSLLAAAGVGRLEIRTSGTVGYEDIAVGGLLPEDLGRPRALAAADAVRRTAPDIDLGPLRDTTPDLAILVGPPPPHPATTIRYARRRCPHLAVWLREGVVVVGPLVRPGRTACLDCLHLQRESRDPAWPAVAAYLSGPDHHAEPAEATVVASGAALAADNALAHLDGGVPASVGRTLEVGAPGEVRRRRWAPHPRCGCVRLPGRG